MCDNVLSKGWYRFEGAAGTKMQQSVCQHTVVVQIDQVGWMVLILQWRMVKFAEMSAVAIVPPVANIKSKFQ